MSLKVSGRVVFADFDWKYHIFLHIKNGGVKPVKKKTIFLCTYSNDLALGSAEIYSLEVVAYVSLKGATTDV